jgi:hypothetical protein
MAIVGESFEGEGEKRTSTGGLGVLGVRLDRVVQILREDSGGDLRSLEGQMRVQRLGCLRYFVNTG